MCARWAGPVEVRGQSCGVCSLSLPLHELGFWGTDSGHQACTASHWAISPPSKGIILNIRGIVNGILIEANIRKTKKKTNNSHRRQQTYVNNWLWYTGSSCSARGTNSPLVLPVDRGKSRSKRLNSTQGHVLACPWTLMNHLSRG